MAAIIQTTFSSAFSCTTIYEFRLKFHWAVFLRVKSTILQHWFKYWLGSHEGKNHYMIQWWPCIWRRYASSSLNGLKNLNEKISEITIQFWNLWPAGNVCTVFPCTRLYTKRQHFIIRPGCIHCHHPSFTTIMNRPQPQLLWNLIHGVRRGGWVLSCIKFIQIIFTHTLQLWIIYI